MFQPDDIVEYYQPEGREVYSLTRTGVPCIVIGQRYKGVTASPDYMFVSVQNPKPAQMGVFEVMQSLFKLRVRNGYNE